MNGIAGSCRRLRGFQLPCTLALHDLTVADDRRVYLQRQARFLGNNDFVCLTYALSEGKCLSRPAKAAETALYFAMRAVSDLGGHTQKDDARLPCLQHDRGP